MTTGSGALFKFSKFLGSTTYVCEKCSGHCVLLISLMYNSMREAREYLALNHCKTLPSHGCSTTINNNQQQEQQVTGQFLVWSIL